MRKDRWKPIVRYYEGLPQIRANAAGMDIGAEEIWVDVGNKAKEAVRRFGTFTADLNEMAEWLKPCGIETVDGIHRSVLDCTVSDSGSQRD